MTDWNERIPAAIAWIKSQDILRGAEWMMFYGAKGSTTPTDIVTREEAALAVALWWVTKAEGWHTDPALTAFAEKIERLGHD